MCINKTKTIGYFFLLLATVFLTSCEDNSSATETPRQNKQPQEVQPSVKEYSITVQAIEMEGKKVRLSISSNIPGNIELMAGISLMGQVPEDIYIGKSERVKVSNGTSEVVINVSDLPSGEYKAEVNFYPMWGLQDEKSKSTRINHEISASQTIVIIGSGEPSELVIKRNMGQKWVMKNVIVGTPWIPNEWKERFGAWEELSVTSMNPKVIKNYYFPSIDMTIIVNIFKIEVVTWRMGKDGV